MHRPLQKRVPQRGLPLRTVMPHNRPKAAFKCEPALVNHDGEVFHFQKNVDFMQRCDRQRGFPFLNCTVCFLAADTRRNWGFFRRGFSDHQTGGGAPSTFIGGCATLKWMVPCVSTVRVVGGLAYKFVAVAAWRSLV